MRTVAALAVVLIAASPAQEDKPVEKSENGCTLKIPKSKYKSHDEVKLEFTLPKDLNTYSWFGVIPSEIEHGSTSTNDAHDVSYEYTNGRASGTVTFKAPGKPGSWDIRLSDASAASGKELLFITFTVAPPPGADIKPSLTPPGKDFTSHQTFAAKFTAPSVWESSAWVGIFRGETPHAEALPSTSRSLYTMTLGGKTEGSLSFRAPGKPGAYELRMFDGWKKDSKEILAAAFTVTAPEDKAKIQPALKLAKNAFFSHEMLDGAFEAPITYEYNGWIGILPADAPHGTAQQNDAHDVAYEYLSGRTEGKLAIRAPGKPGKYDLRLHDTSWVEGKEILSVPFEVKLPERGDRKPVLKTDKEKYALGEKIAITFEAPAYFHYQAWIGLIPSDVSHGETSKNDQHDVAYEYIYGRMEGSFAFTAPSTAGKWDLRMSDAAWGGDGKEHHFITITVGN